MERKKALVGLPRLLRERYLVRARREGVRRLVEAYVAIVADAQELQVDAAAIGDGALIGVEHRLRIGGEAVRHMRVARLYIYVVKELLLHKAAVTLRVAGGEAGVFVEVERAHAGKVHAPRPVAGNQRAIEGERRRAGGQPQHAGRPGGDLHRKEVGGEFPDALGGVQREHADTCHVSHSSLYTASLLL